MKELRDNPKASKFPLNGHEFNVKTGCVSRLTLHAIRTPPDLPAVLSLLPASSAPPIASVQAVPVTFFSSGGATHDKVP